MKRRSKESGSVIIEFALSMPLLIYFLFGTADLGRMFHYSIEVANAAAAGAQFGSFNTTNMTNTAGISAAAKADAPDIPSASLSVSSSVVCQDTNGNVVSCTTNGARQYVKVVASYVFQTIFSYPMIPSSVSLTDTVMMRGA